MVFVDSVVTAKRYDLLDRHQELLAALHEIPALRHLTEQQLVRFCVWAFHYAMFEQQFDGHTFFEVSKDHWGLGVTPNEVILSLVAVFLAFEHSGVTPASEYGGTPP